jgi:hypothetical protein
VLPAGSVATSRYVALREEGKSVGWLCLVILPTQSCILEKRFFHPSVSVGIIETSTSKTWGGVRAAPQRAACRCASLCRAR